MYIVIKRSLVEVLAVVVIVVAGKRGLKLIPQILVQLVLTGQFL